MNAKNLRLIFVLAAGAAISAINLNAAQPALSPKAKANQARTVAVTTAEPNLLARNPEVAASPKVLANFPQLARGHKTQSGQPIVACTCCKP